MINIIWNICINKQEYRRFGMCSVYTTPFFTPEHEGWLTITDTSKEMFNMHTREYHQYKQLLRTYDNPINLWQYALTYWVHNTKKQSKNLKRNIPNDERGCTSICGNDNN